MKKRKSFSAGQILANDQLLWKAEAGELLLRRSFLRANADIPKIDDDMDAEQFSAYRQLQQERARSNTGALDQTFENSKDKLRQNLQRKNRRKLDLYYKEGENSASSRDPLFASYLPRTQTEIHEGTTMDKKVIVFLYSWGASVHTIFEQCQ